MAPREGPSPPLLGQFLVKIPEIKKREIVSHEELIQARIPGIPGSQRRKPAIAILPVLETEKPEMADDTDEAGVEGVAEVKAAANHANDI